MGVIVVNFKTYKQATGEQAVKLAKICEEASKETDTQIIVAVQNVDLFHVSSQVSIPVYAEHVDPVTYGAHTGKDLPESLIDNGATGTLINHSEDSDELKDIAGSISRAKAIGLKTIVCAPTSAASEALAALGPDMIAIEPPELIGGNISVSKAQPELITDTIKKVRLVDDNLPVLCGAGIKDSEDVRIAIKLGCEGILIASGITKADDPKAALLELIKGLKR